MSVEERDSTRVQALKSVHEKLRAKLRERDKELFEELWKRKRIDVFLTDRQHKLIPIHPMPEMGNELEDALANAYIMQAAEGSRQKTFPLLTVRGMRGAQTLMKIWVNVMDDHLFLSGLEVAPHLRHDLKLGTKLM